jgi:type I restriction enzyme M protein
MGNAGRNGGEYYTPRPLIRAMIQVTRPRIGERIYDAAAGSAGFLCEAHDYLRYGADGKGDGSHLSTSDLEILQTRTFYAKEKKSLPYVIGIMNMILHGIEAPNVVHTNSLTENLSDIQEKDRFVVLTRFSGHFTVTLEGVKHGQSHTEIYTGVSPADGRAVPSWAVV